jgi:hypothetical protein
MPLAAVKQLIDDCAKVDIAALIAEYKKKS